MASESLRIFLRMNRSLSVFRQVEGVTPNSVAEKPSEDEYIRLRLGDRDIITQNIGTCVPGTISNLRVTSNNPSLKKGTIFFIRYCLKLPGFNYSGSFSSCSCIYFHYSFARFTLSVLS